MEEDDYEKRRKLIRKLLEHLKSGDLNKQIPRTKSRDKLEEEAELANMEIQEVEAGMLRLAYVHPNKAYMFVAEMSITLSRDFRIISITEKAEKILNYSSDGLVGRMFKSILQPSSAGHWQKLESLLRDKKLENNMIALDFTTGNGLKVSAQGTLSILKGKGHGKYSFTSYKAFVYTEHFNKLDPWLWQKQSTQNQVESEGIRRSGKVRDYIMKNLRHKTIDFDRLAEELRVSPRRLLKEFRRIYGMTPFQYHKHEKLIRMKFLIETTDYPLKEIALDYGFPDYEYFSRMFTEKFNKTPTETREEANKNK